MLQSDLAEGERQKASTFFAPGTKRASQRHQERLELNWDLLGKARPALVELFDNKCAFCESPDTTENPLNVGHFRPATEIFEPLSAASSSASSRTGYWWLAYEWENLYLVCRACADRSQLAFPVAARRAAPGTRGAALALEQPLLLDPCADRPELHLTFLTAGADGRVVERDPAEKRGRTTIELLDLNRDQLIRHRAQAMALLRKEWTLSLPHKFSGKWAVRVPNLLKGSRPYLGCLRELTFALTAEFGKTVKLTAFRRLTRLLSAVVPGMRELPSEWDELRAVASSAPKGRPVPAAHSWYLRRVEIRNFKAIGKLALDIPRGTSGEKGWQTGWKVLLGENGAGKSTVLQAIVLAFMGEKFLRSQDVAPRSLLRRQGAGTIATSGFVKLFWVDRKAPTVMRFTRTQCRFEGETPPREFVLRAYGATRHLPRGRHRATPDARPKDVQNLFDPFQPVCDADAWLRQLKGAKAFGSAALSLKDLLGLTPRTRLSRQGGKVRVRIGGVDVGLDELSAGYQSVVVLAIDIMAGVHGRAHDLRYASGVMLIDELDAHLHPRWKMQIVTSLRRTFPGLQFIATTHEPLCLRGLKTGEITVMRRKGRAVEVISDVPSPEGLRVDQLLTSPLFGLHSTVDPEADRDFQRYYQLLGKPSLSSEEESERQRLSGRLAEAGLLGAPVVGSTRRTQLIYDAVDQYLANEPLSSADPQRQVREETKQKVADIWKDVLLETAAT